MGEPGLSQTSIRRAISDTISSQKTARFMWGGEGVLAVAGVTWLVQIAPASASTLEIVTRSVLGGFGGLVTAILIIFAWTFARTPYKQRNEARKLVKQQRTPTESEVNDVVRLLEDEKLVSRNNEGEERSYSLSQVFLAIADYLAVGFTFPSLEGYVRKGLGINEKEGWYFPHEDLRLTHVIGVFAQNDLVERHSEEYQRMVRDYPQDIDDITLDIINVGNPLYRKKPPQHLEKGTEVKYYLSPLGDRVIRQLRQQSIADKEGSQTE